MKSDLSKVFSVIVMKCEDALHARKLAALLRRSFAHRGAPAADDDSSSGFSLMVTADSAASVRSAISEAVGASRVVIGEMSWLCGEDGQMTSEPPEFIQFLPPDQC